jgi:hypothetical protein
VVGRGNDAALNFGGVFEANSCATNTLNIGVYASARFNDGFALCREGYAGFFQGSVVSTGTDIFISDANLKDSGIWYTGHTNGA